MELTVNLVLGSKSPRRAQLLRDLGFDFKVIVTDADESAPKSLSPAETAVWISEQKALALQGQLGPNELGITSDTEVWMNNTRFGKPKDSAEAAAMLQQLSGKTHQVISGLTLVTPSSLESHFTTVEVDFLPIPDWAIAHYITQYQPLDKAGAYGIQEWLGMGYISAIRGEYNSVVGLPTSTLMQALLKYAK